MSLLIRLALLMLAAGLLSDGTCLRATEFAGDFEELGASARALGLGNAVVALASDASAIYYNPALCSRFARKGAEFLHSEDFAGLVRHNYVAVVFPTRPQAFGFAVLQNWIPDIKLTEWDSAAGRPRVSRIVDATQTVAYVCYSRSPATWLALGGNAKVIYQNLGGTGSCFGMGLDMGLAITPQPDITVGVRVRNASTSPLFWDTGTREVVSPAVSAGFAKTLTLGRDRLTAAMGVETDFFSPALLPQLGLEYVFRNVLSGRIGSYRGNLAFGAGIRFGRFHVEYGYAAGAAPGARELGSPQQLSGGVEF